jgi:D-alanyl-D-alanine carboxypeptidase (penicillin-binding protein 5/6)
MSAAPERAGAEAARRLGRAVAGRRLAGALLAAALVGASAAAGWASVPAVAAAEPPSIVAGNAIVLAEPGPVVLLDRAMHEPVPPASLTKIMTAHVALQRGDLAQRLVVAPSDLVGQASMGLRAGETLTLEALLYGLLLPSGNDAAMTIARGLGARAGDGSDSAAVARFVGWMNEEAARPGLRQTHFVNPHGLDRPGHVSSAADLARLTLVAAQDPRFVRIAGRPSAIAAGRSLRHGHPLVGRTPGVLAGKTGRTRGCRSCLMTLAERDGRRVVVVVLRSTREAVVDDTTALLAWGFTQPLVTPTPTAPPPTAPPSPTATPPPTASLPPTATPPPVATPALAASASPVPPRPADAAPAEGAPGPPAATSPPPAPAGGAVSAAAAGGGAAPVAATGEPAAPVGWPLLPALAGLGLGAAGIARSWRRRG